jgi:phenylalanyl-tRNA synthetase beta chain
VGIPQRHTVSIEQDDVFAYGLEYKVETHSIVKLGLVNKSWLDQFDIRQPVFIADFDLESLIHAAGTHQVIYEELNRFPAVERDLAIVVSDKTVYEDIHRVALNAGGKWLTDVQVFDNGLYEIQKALVKELQAEIRK